MSITTVQLNERVKVLDAVIDGHAMTLCGLEGRLAALELEVGNFDPNEYEPLTMAEMHKTLRITEKKLLEALVSLVDKRAAEVMVATDEPLVDLTDRHSRILYIDQVAKRLAARKLTAAEAKTLLYAAQLHSSGGGE